MAGMFVRLETDHGDIVHETHVPVNEAPDSISFGGRMFYKFYNNGNFICTYREGKHLAIELPNAEVGSDGVTVIRAADK